MAPKSGQPGLIGGQPERRSKAIGPDLNGNLKTFAM